MIELDFIHQFLRDNAAYARDKFADRSGLTVTSKTDATDLLTEVDLTLQKRAVEEIRKNFPGDAILAEEGEFTAMPDDPSGRCWVMDPIDGTSNFVRGRFPIFGISIAFADGGRAQAGGVGLPGTGDIFLAERGKGTTLNGERITVSEVRDTAIARVDVDFSSRGDREAMLTRAAPLIKGVGQVRCYGSAVAALVQIAAGDADGYVHMTLKPWDYAAGQLLVEEAGGMATRLDGQPLGIFDNGKGVMITNGALHQSLLALVKRS